MSLTIYFAGAISGGREDVARYREIVAAEHVGSDGERLESRRIFERDMGWIGDADVLVAEVSKPSTGVGYKIASARYRRRIPVVCLYRPVFTNAARRWRAATRKSSRSSTMTPPE